MIISLIAAASTNRVIGVGNDLPWRLPADMQWFKEKTLHHHILMGRTTWEILGKPLPNRTSLVISTSQPVLPEGVSGFISLEEGIAFAKAKGEEELMIIGGGKIYEAALPLANRLYITHVHTKVANGTAFFPPVSATEWQIISAQYRTKDERNPLDMEFVILDRKPNKQVG